MGFTLDDDEGSAPSQKPIAGAGDVDAAAAAIAASAPEPTQHAQDFTDGNSSTADTNGSVGADLDSAGVPWSADQHASTKAKNKDGTWKKRRNVGKVGASTKEQTKVAAAAEATTQEQAGRAMMAGRVAATSQFMVCSAIFGPEWRAIVQVIAVPDGTGGEVKVTLNELEEMSDLWGKYFIASGRTDFPPGVALTMGILSYASRRFTMPETQRRVSSFKEWAAARIAAWKVRRAEKKRASANSGADAQRKNDAGNPPVSSVQAR